MTAINWKILSKQITMLILLVFVSILPFTAANASPLLQEGPTYIVQSGDSLNTIALRFGIPPDEIQSINEIVDPNSLFIGQRLIIPGLEGITGILTLQTLSFGSSLNGLIRQYGLTVSELTSLNRLTSPSETIAGVSFIVPVDETQEPFSPILSIDSNDTAIELAILTDTSPWTLVEHNQLAGTWDFFVGDTLFGITNNDINMTLLPGISEISIHSLPVVQGETLLVSVSTTNSEIPTGNFNGETLYFFSDDSDNFYSFHGIHALAEPGVLPLNIIINSTDGESHSFEQMILLSAGNYRNDPNIRVEELYVDPQIIAEEDQVFNQILNQYTPERYWDGQFQYPVDEPCINGYYGNRRDYNDGALFYYHTGLDFEVCAPNLNIYAPAAGKVAMAEELIIRGNTILIDHGWGVYSAYVHLSEFSVQVGDMVQPGDLLGLIGDTGRSLGPHLHFEINLSGTPVNPLTWLQQEFP